MLGSVLSGGVWVLGYKFNRGQFVLILPNWGVGVFRKGGTISIYNLLKILLWRKKNWAHQEHGSLSVCLSLYFLKFNIRHAYGMMVGWLLKERE